MKKEKRFNGKPMSHWENQAKRVIIQSLIRAADLDTSSIVGRLAQPRLLELAKTEDPVLYKEILAERNRYMKNVAKTLNAMIRP